MCTHFSTLYFQLLSMYWKKLNLLDTFSHQCYLAILFAQWSAVRIEYMFDEEKINLILPLSDSSLLLFNL